MDDIARPVVEPVFVHGDLWAGNVLWDGDSYVATVDWEAAGAGSHGVDLGSLRLDAALLYGQETPSQVLVGWEVAMGRQATEVAYWDLAAALNTSADMTGATPTMHAAGRTDLDCGALTRRDEFLEEALRQLA